MSLQNLLKIGQLKEHPADGQEIERLLAAAERNLRDAHVKDISPETRFDAAYKAIMQSALAAEDVLEWRKVHRPNLAPKRR